MATCDLLDWLRIAQTIALLVVTHVAVGVYGCYYLVRSLGFPSENDQWRIVHPARTVAVERTIQSSRLPDTATAMPFVGLLTASVLGIVAVLVLLLVVLPVATRSETVGRVTIEWFFTRRAEWPTGPTRRYREQQNT